jgi:glycosyltransferase involved in cell wall biosynthesis
MTQNLFYVALPTGENFGWGICGTYLKSELSKRCSMMDVQEKITHVPAPLFMAIEGASLRPWKPTTGDKTVGYVFFEDDLPASSVEQSKIYNIILAGSKWCADRMREKGIQHVDVLIQGVDPELFHPAETAPANDRFILFSGGKFELRKGQDLILKAFAQLHKKYPDMDLLTIWENQWEFSLNTMKLSKHIRFERKGTSWPEQLKYLCLLNGIDPNRVQACPLLPNRKMRSIFARTHLGIFANRCEGGTNLVLMEYMACGKPVVASYSSGHRDILTDQNALCLKNLQSIEGAFPDIGTSFHWDEVNIDELIAKIEYAYHHRDEIASIGQEAANSMKPYTWATMAERTLSFLKS